jgi:hypothetical protein
MAEAASDSRDLAVLRTSARFGAFAQVFTLRDEVVQLRQRHWLQSLQLDVPVEHLPRERTVVSSIGILGAFIALCGLGTLVLVACFAQGADKWPAMTCMGVVAACGAIAAIWQTRTTVILKNQVLGLVIFCRRRQLPAVEQFLQTAHEAKLRIISRRLALVSSVVQIEEMFRRLSFYLDSRIISSAEFEALNQQLVQTKLTAS